MHIHRFTSPATRGSQKLMIEPSTELMKKARFKDKNLCRWTFSSRPLIRSIPPATPQITTQS